MSKTIEEAMLRAWHEYRFGSIQEGDDPENDPVKPSDNFEKGFIAGCRTALSGQWISISNKPKLAEGSFLKVYFHTTRGYEPGMFMYSHGRTLAIINEDHGVQITHYMFIPPLNTEKP